MYIYIHIYVYTYLYRGEGLGVPAEGVGTFSLSPVDICIFCRSCIQMGGGGGDVNVHCIASSLHCVIRRYCYVEDRCCIQMGGGGMLTFIAFCHQKMLLR